RTGVPLTPPLRHYSKVRAAAFSPDGKWVVTGSEDGTARVWDTATGKLVAEPLRHEAAVWAVDFSRDGRTVLTGTLARWPRPAEARLWNAATGKPLGPPLVHRGGHNFFAVAFGRDGRTVLTGSEDGPRVWPTPASEEVGGTPE